jgi:diacylglycerol O-acyltransferase / wax synthase
MVGVSDAERFEHHMSDADALMWNIEKDPLLRSTIVTMLVFDRSPDFEQLLDRVDRGSRLIPRMRQRVVTPLMRIGPPHWSADPHFDLAYHVRRVRAPEPRTLETVLELARTAAMTGFDRARPLWEYTSVDGLADGRSALVIKVHHSMTDGVGGMKLLMMLFDLEREPAPPGPVPDSAELAVLGRLELVSRSLDHRRRRALGIARRAAAGALTAAQHAARDPVGTVAESLRVARSVIRYLEPATTPRSPLMRERTLARQLATLEIPLGDLKRAAKAVGGSLNDAFVAGVLGGFRRYHEFHGEPVDDLRMVMPINVRAEGDALGGNHFTPARFLVPLDIKDPAERVREVGRLVHQVRDEPAVALTDALAGVLNQLPTSVTTALFGAMLKGADFVTSNVPGAPFPIYTAGAELERMYAFAPLSGAAANVTLLSHCGTCCIGINTDLVAIPDTQPFVQSLEAGLDEVLALA